MKRISDSSSNLYGYKHIVIHVLVGFDDGEHGVGHTEGVLPVVVGHRAIVLAHRQSEANKRFLVKPTGIRPYRHVLNTTLYLHM